MAISPNKFINEKVVELKNKAAGKKLLVACSGGVDSLVCAVIAKRAVGDSLDVIFLDTGLLREGESKHAAEAYSKFGLDLQVWDTGEAFFDALKGRLDPEEKRTVFRDVFYRKLNQAVKSYSADFLVQGTIASDIIEAQKGIKTQHNVLSQAGVSPLHFALKIIEPLKDLYKTQVKQVAKVLGIPHKIYGGRPFPGPGFAIRIMGEVVPLKVEKIRTATRIVEETITGEKPYQVFPVLLSDRATGLVKGKRGVGDIVVIRAVESEDALSAEVHKIPWPRLEKVRDRILAEVPGVVKVLYDITGKPPSTIEFI